MFLFFIFHILVFQQIQLDEQGFYFQLWDIQVVKVFYIKDAFLLDEKANLALADRYWQQEVSGNHSFVQRARRLVFKVPHYKTGDELAKAVAAAKAGQP